MPPVSSKRRGNGYTSAKNNDNFQTKFPWGSKHSNVRSKEDNDKDINNVGDYDTYSCDRIEPTNVPAGTIIPIVKYV